MMHQGAAPNTIMCCWFDVGLPRMTLDNNASFIYSFSDGKTYLYNNISSACCFPLTWPFGSNS